MPHHPGAAITDHEWKTIMKWRESNPDKTHQDLRVHFARPENGSLRFSDSVFYDRLEKWKELKKRCRDGESPKTSLQAGKGRVLRDEEWVEVFEFVDQHPGWSRAKVADHFYGEGRLKFCRTTLEGWLLKRKSVQRRVNEAKKKLGSQSWPYNVRAENSSGPATSSRWGKGSTQAREVLPPRSPSKSQQASRHQTAAAPYPLREESKSKRSQVSTSPAPRRKGKAVHVTPSSTSPGSWVSSRSTLSPTSSSSSRLSVDLSLYDPTLAPIEALPSEAGGRDDGAHFWVYGYPVASLSGLATLNRDVFKRKEPGFADTEEETKLDLWSGTCDLITNLRVYTAYPDVHLALVEGRPALIGVEGEGAGSSEATLVMWAISLVCAKSRGKYEGRPTVGHLRKLEPILGKPRWFEALKDRKTFCFEV